MKLFKLSALACFLFANSLYSAGFGFNIGPFDMQFNLNGDGFKAYLDDPICFAISNQYPLEMTVEGRDVVNDKEEKIVIKRLTVEPYAFGITNEGNPVLQGKVVQEKLIEEIIVKYGDKQFEEKTKSDKEKRFFSGWFRSDKSQNIDIRKVSDLRVMEGSRFDAPKNYKGFDETVRVICRIPTSS